MKKLKVGPRNFLYYLSNQYNYFKELSRLDEDGSFYKSDKIAAEYINVSSKTIKRWREILKKEGFIYFIPGRHVGDATRYWILKENDKMDGKGDKLNGEGDKLSYRGRQNVPPYKEIIKEKNKEKREENYISPFFFKTKKITEKTKTLEDVSAETINELREVLGEEQLNRYLLDKGYVK